MNKILRTFGISSLITILSTLPGQSNAGQYYVGTNIGASVAQNLGRGSITNVDLAGPEVYQQPRFYTNKNSLSGGIFGGYTHNFDKLIIGAEVGGNLTHNKSLNTYDFKDLGDSKYLYILSLNRSWSLNLSAKAGLSLSESLTASLLMGASYSRFKVEQQGTLNTIIPSTVQQETSQLKNLWAFVPGIEFNYYLNSNKNLSLGVVYTYEMYQSFTPNALSLDELAVPSYSSRQIGKISPRFHNIMGRITYKF